MSALQIVGAGGLGREIYQYLVDLGRSGGVSFLDDTPDIFANSPWAAVGVRPIDAFDLARPCLIALGDPAARAALAERLAVRGADFETFVHPRAYVAGNAYLAPGCIVAPFACVGPQAQLAAHVLMGPYASVGHDSRVGACAVLSPYATINGHVVLDGQVFLGTQSVVTPRLRVGEAGKISAGAVVFSSVPAGALALGNPARWRRADA